MTTAKFDFAPDDLLAITGRFTGSRKDELLSKVPSVEQLCGRHYQGISCALLIGSCVAQQDGPLSDVDLLLVVESGQRIARRQVIYNGLPLQITSMTLGHCLNVMEPQARPQASSYIPALLNAEFLFGSRDVHDLLVRKARERQSVLSVVAREEVIRQSLMAVSIYLLELIKYDDDNRTLLDSGELIKNAMIVLAAESHLPVHEFGDPGALRGNDEFDDLCTALCEYIAERGNMRFLKVARSFLQKRNWVNWAFDGEIALRY